MKHHSFSSLINPNDPFMRKKPSADVLNLALTEICNGKSVQEVWQALLNGLDLYHITKVRYGLTRFRHGESIGDPEDALFLSSRKANGDDPYVEAGRYRSSPVFRWMAQNDGVCSWGWVMQEEAAGRLSPSEQAHVNAVRKSGYIAGYTISFPSDSKRMKGGIGLSAPYGMNQNDMDRLWAEQGDQITLLCTMAHLKFQQLPMPFARKNLRPRQREVLEWIADGKTVQDIALLMSLSVSAVEKHLRAARDALGAETTPQAVSKAIFLNQIFATDGDSDSSK